MGMPTLLPDPTYLHLKLLDASETAITAVVTTTSEEATCPVCHQRSTRIHSRYERAVADLPWMGCAVHLELHVRRFFCPNSECARQIFTERLPTVVAPYARRGLPTCSHLLALHLEERQESGWLQVWVWQPVPIPCSGSFAPSQKSKLLPLGFWGR